jgi:hypothetical protein
MGGGGHQLRLGSVRNQACAASLAAALLLLPASCNQRRPGPLDGSPQAWPFRPASIAFHALTRSESADASESLLVRVEFRDREGDLVKAVGTLVVSVACRGAEPSESEHPFDLADASVNRELFDPVTLTYRIRIARPWSVPPRSGSEISLTARLEQHAGDLAATTRILW